MKDNRIVNVDFKDINEDYTCVVEYNGRKKIVPKSVIMKQIIENKRNKTISIKSKTQFFYDRFRYGGFITGEDVFKYIILFPGGDKMIIKNVCESDLYYEELEALSAYRAKIVLKKDEIYPDFPKKSDFSYRDPDSKKRK